MCLQSLFGEMTPSAPVKDFRFPRFADNGYTEWVLQGGRGIYDSEEQIRVEEMSLRVYSGDERMALELTLDSPEATLRLKENRAFSDSVIRIEGADFKISGVGWTWNGATKEIEVLYDTVVEFTQSISDTFAESKPADSSLKRTEIESERLLLKTTETDYRFEFTNKVHAVSGEMDLRSNVLIALADAPEGREDDSKAVAPGQLDSVRQIIARDAVVIKQAGRIVRAGEAEFFTREKLVHLSGNPQVEASGAYLSGDQIRSKEGEIVITGGGDAGRAQMILTETGGLGIQGGGALSSETIVLADSITMRELEKENHFYFEGSVEVMSAAVQMQAQKMTILANKTTEKPKEVEPADESLKVGEVRSLFAEGEVRIEQEGQVATGEKVTFYPAEERAVLTGNPQVTNGEAVVTGERMELKPGLALISSVGEARVSVILPKMPDLGYDPLGSNATSKTEPIAVEATVEGPMEAIASLDATSAEPDSSTAVANSETVIQSRQLRMIEEPSRTIFRFTDKVSVKATNLDASCERLDVIAAPDALADISNASSSERLEVERIEAFENVEIKQSGRVATSKSAFILPREGKMILEGDSVVNDDRGRVTGYRMTLLQGERRAIVETGGADRPRNTVTLPQMPNGKF